MAGRRSDHRRSIRSGRKGWRNDGSADPFGPDDRAGAAELSGLAVAPGPAARLCGEAEFQMKYAIHPVGVIRSPLKRREDAPMQGHEGAPDAWAEIDPAFTDALDGIGVGDEVIVITWLHESHRDVLKVHPRKDTGKPLTGVFA